LFSSFTSWRRGQTSFSNDVAATWTLTGRASELPEPFRFVVRFADLVVFLFFSFLLDSVWRDMGFFITGFLIVSGLALPIALQQAGSIGISAMIMSIAGGVIIYGSVALYAHYFSKKSSDF
jgi:hypothetical protein